jgi:hypothetical protein
MTASNYYDRGTARTEKKNLTLLWNNKNKKANISATNCDRATERAE